MPDDINTTHCHAQVTRHRLSGEALTELFNTLFEHNLAVRVAVSGQSMAPHISQGDILVIQRCQAEDLRFGDISLCVSASGQSRVHRFIQHHDDQYITMGDALASPDPAATRDGILGRVVLVERVGSDGTTVFTDLRSRSARLRALAVAARLRLNLVLGRVRHAFARIMPRPGLRSRVNLRA